MPTYDFICEECGMLGREWRCEGVIPRFCSRECMAKGMTGKSRNWGKYPITPEIHEKIKRVYQTMTGNGEVNTLAKEIGYPRWKISGYAIQQGWIAVHEKQPDWGEKELEILERSAHLGAERIQLHLKKAGFSRSATAIILKKKRMRFSQNLQGHSASSVSECFGVDPKTITRWISLGMLKARKRGTKRTSRQGGDYWFIKDVWIKRFIVDYLNTVDIRKVDKYWFVDLMGG